MTLPTALKRAMRQLVDTIIVDVRRRDGEWMIDTHIDQPGFTAGRYGLMPVEDIELMMRRLQTVEHAKLLAKVKKKAAGTRTLKRR